MATEEVSPLTTRLLDDDEYNANATTTTATEVNTTSTDRNKSSRRGRFFRLFGSKPPPSSTSTNPTETAALTMATATATATENASTNDNSWERGEKQPLQYRDWPFALLFYVQFLAVVALGIIYINEFLNSINDNNYDNYYGNYNYDVSTQNHKTTNKDIMNKITIPILFSALSTNLLILLALIILTTFAQSFITFSVWTSASLSFIIGIIALSTNMIPLGCLSLFSAFIGVCYAISVRHRIPFAAANLNAGGKAIQRNFGVVFIVLLLGGVCMFGYIMLWIGSLIGVVNIEDTCDNNGDNGGGDAGDDDNCHLTFHHPHYIVLWVFFLFWTQQVFKNVIHTSVSGIVGTWYYDPNDANSCCSPSIGQSFRRSLTYSFGSICFGSLCVAILQTLDWMVNMLRNEREHNGQDSNVAVSLLLCCLDCVLRILEGIVEFFNKFVSFLPFLYVFVCVILLFCDV